jgi:hypothetical protein
MHGIALTLTAVLAGAGSGWTPAPTPPFDQAAGVTCDFAVHAEPVVDEVETKVLDRYPDGSIHRDAYRGDLVVRVTNTASGKYYDADAGGSAVIDHHRDGSQTWYVAGPVLAGFRAGSGNVPRGLYVLDGIYRLEIGADGTKTLTVLHGSRDNVCDHLA